MKIAGLGFGTWMGGALACTFSYCTLRKYNLSVKFKLKELKFSEFIGFIRLGISTSGNAENVCRALTAAKAAGTLTAALTGLCGTTEGTLATLLTALEAAARADSTEEDYIQTEHQSERKHHSSAAFQNNIALFDSFFVFH